MELPLGLTDAALAAADAEPDPGSLAASVRLREEFGAGVAAAAITQVVLRRRAASKFGAAAATMFFTRDGLEQATRPEVARHHAARFRQAGASRVVDLGCGIGADARAFTHAGLEVVAVERDPQTAAVARANLAGHAEVLVGDIEELAAELVVEGSGVFCDPARRTTRGRSWRMEDLSPPWSFVLGLLTADRPTGVKLGPGVPHRMLPLDAEAEWVAHAGDTVELGLWSGPGSEPGARSARVIPDARLVADPSLSALPLERVAEYLYEPVGAVVRAGALGALATALEAGVLHPDVAYLTAQRVRPTPFATAFRVLETFGYSEKALRGWVRERRIGSLEIKTRGLDLDPAELRRRLRLSGDQRATVVLTRGARGASARESAQPRGGRGVSPRESAQPRGGRGVSPRESAQPRGSAGKIVIVVERLVR